MIKYAILIATLFLLLVVFNVGWFCPFLDGIGIPCPGCGFTSATRAFLALNFSKAFYHHPLVFIMPFIVPVVIYDKLLSKKSKLNYPLGTNILIGLFFIVYVLRLNGMIPNSATLTLNDNSLLVNLFNYFM